MDTNIFESKQSGFRTNDNTPQLYSNSLGSSGENVIFGGSLLIKI